MRRQGRTLAGRRTPDIQIGTLCPDNDVDRALDEKRIAWAAGDIINNRTPLSRWHPEYAACSRPSSQPIQKTRLDRTRNEKRQGTGAATHIEI